MNIFSAAMLRSGSTHIERGLAHILNWRTDTFTGIVGEGQGEQLINPFTWQILANRQQQVFGGHYCAYANTLVYLQRGGLKPIVCIRNLYDTVASVKDRIEEIGGHGQVLPPAYIPMLWSEWEDEQKLLWIARNIGVWQIKFFMSWDEAACEKLWVKYEDFFADQTAGFKRILNFYEVSDPQDFRIEQATMSRVNNFNKGVVGRGKDLPKIVRCALDDLTDSWGPFNASRIRGALY